MTSDLLDYSSIKDLDLSSKNDKTPHLRSRVFFPIGAGEVYKDFFTFLQKNLRTLTRIRVSRLYTRASPDPARYQPPIHQNHTKDSILSKNIKVKLFCDAILI